MPESVYRTEFPYLEGVSRGKVRDIYPIGDRLLIVSTDRLSTFDMVLPTPIPGRGRILTQMSLFWFAELGELCPNHVVTAEPESIADAVSVPREARAEFVDTIRGRAMLVRRAEVFGVECVARGYLAGSGWKEYRREGKVCGLPLPKGLRESDRLPEPIFTPTTKAKTGHDRPVAYREVEEMIGAADAALLRDLTLRLYTTAAEYALSRGIIIADTKFEFGRIDGEIALVDEALTPDSSRFWDAETYAPGGPQASFDKQYVRDWLIAQGWSGEGPPPELPGDVVARTVELYENALHRLTI
jgi:phosphoribosylaminoimidazole-succinocarboxamide synthase